MQTSAPQFRGVLNSICEILPKLLIDDPAQSSLCELYGDGEHIGKFSRLNVKNYGCIDPSEDVIKEMKKKWTDRTKIEANPDTFITCTLSSSSISAAAVYQFDYLVCYSHRMEHAFSTEAKAISFMNNASQFIRSGGYFFGYFFDSSLVWTLFQDMTKHKDSNLTSTSVTLSKKQRYSLKISNLEDGNFSKFGTSYTFHVDKEKDKRSGCMIHFASFLQIASNAGFRVISTDNMLQFYEDYQYIYHEIFQGYHVYKKSKTIQPSDSALINMFNIFILQKES